MLTKYVHKSQEHLIVAAQQEHLIVAAQQENTSLGIWPTLSFDSVRSQLSKYLLKEFS